MNMCHVDSRGGGMWGLCLKLRSYLVWLWLVDPSAIGNLCTVVVLYGLHCEF